ncbi:MAG: two-component sensor histidine kinase [Candidatus Accumulibacter sp.]|jgi:two-component system OmpR family sensor kinase|nr:two-component sensor histidine kinase [Accumulibacter sp.]
MNSIRRHLLIALLGTLCAAILLGGGVTYRVARGEAGALFDYHLQQIALSLRDQRFQGSVEALAGDRGLDYVIRVWDRNGLTVFYSRPHDTLPELTRLGYSTTETREGAWRLYAIQYNGQTIAVAQPMRVRDRQAAAVAWRTLEPFLILLPLFGLLIWRLVGWGLRPLGRLAESVKARTPDLLDPLPDADVPEEARPLVDSLNDLLARLKMALDAQRAFVADAAHELRTPLAALQLQAQLVERAPSDEERHAALGDLKDGLQRATHGVQQLLTLARQEPGAVEARQVPVRLAPLARESVTGHYPLAAARRIDLGVSYAEEEATVVGDAGALKILLDNLIANALRHAPEGGRVDVACGVRDGAAYLEVADDGPGIPPEERERVFDRFYRRGGGSGAGLGLAIVKLIAQRHGATVRLLDSDAGGLLARVDF